MTPNLIAPLAALTLTLSLALARGDDNDSPPAPWTFTPEALQPFWRSDTVRGESLLFVQDDPARPPSARLLFPPRRVLSLVDPSGQTTYQPGRDYRWEPGSRHLVLTPGSPIPFATPDDLRRPPGSQPYALTHRDGRGEIRFGASHEYHDLQPTVTYQYDPAAWAGPRPAFAAEQLPRTIARLQAKGDLAIVLLGDSISTGCNASGWAGVPPHQPPFQDLLVQNLQAHYGARVRLTNLSLGGMSSAWARQQTDAVIAAQPDLLILAFGMNDAAGVPATEFQANLQAVVEAVGRARPETEFILVAPMRGNADWTALQPSLFPQYRDALADLARAHHPGVALADLTSVWTELLRLKPDRDLTGNGVNHPNDFGHRLYAQVLSTLLIPEPEPRPAP